MLDWKFYPLSCSFFEPSLSKTSAFFVVDKIRYGLGTVVLRRVQTLASFFVISAAGRFPVTGKFQQLVFLRDLEKICKRGR